VLPQVVEARTARSRLLEKRVLVMSGGGGIERREGGRREGEGIEREADDGKRGGMEMRDGGAGKWEDGIKSRGNGERGRMWNRGEEEGRQGRGQREGARRLAIQT
jgi:hypothetical protein